MTGDARSEETVGRIGDFYPTDCVLCGHESETHEEHEQHMEEAHDC